jgi:hypothetical protein
MACSAEPTPPGNSSFTWPSVAKRMVQRIDVAPDGISVTLHAAGIRSLVAELADQEAPAPAASEPLLEAAE